MDKELFLKIVWAFLALFFLLHAFGALKILSFEAIAPLLGLPADQELLKPDYLKESLDAEFALLYFLVLITMFWYLLMPKIPGKLGRLREKISSNIFKRSEWLAYFTMDVLIAIGLAAILAQAKIQTTHSSAVFTAWLALSVVAFDNTVDLNKKYLKKFFWGKLP